MFFSSVLLLRHKLRKYFKYRKVYITAPKCRGAVKKNQKHANCSTTGNKGVD